MRNEPETQLQTILTEPSRDESQLGEQHPLAHILGTYKDDLMLDLVMEEVYKNRRRMDAEMDAEAESNVTKQADLAA